MPPKPLPNSAKKNMPNHTEPMRTKNKIKATVLHGDCASLLDRQNTSFGHVDLIFLDPPFNQDKGYNEWDDNLPEAQYWKWMGDVCTEDLRPNRFGGRNLFYAAGEKD